MSNPLPVPASAKQLFVSVEQIGGDVYSTINLAHLRGQPVASANRRALKVLNIPNRANIVPAPIDILVEIQDEDDHPCAYIYEYNKGSADWYAMEHVRGYNIARLSTLYEESGIPPWLLFDILLPLIRGLLRLQDRGLCFIDMQDGDNVMVHNSASTMLFQTTFIGFEGIVAYNKEEDTIVLQQVLTLAKRMIGGKIRVPEVYRRRRGGEAFDQKDLKDADYFYKFLVTGEYLEHFTYDTLSMMWEALSPEMAKLSEQLKDDAMAEELRKVLSIEEVSYETIVSAVARDQQVWVEDEMDID